MTAIRKTWRGAETLRRFLVPLDQLEPFPGNPRRGAVGEVMQSLARFGQVRPVLVAATEGEGPRRIVAGHHVVEAARELGWSHVAAIANEFASEDEARAYLLADNKLSELGTDDPDLLAAQLASLADFQGTGYTQQEADELAARLAFLRDPVFPETDDAPPPLDERSVGPETFEVPLLLSRPTRQDFARQISMLRREWGLETTTDVVVRAVREAAERA